MWSAGKLLIPALVLSGCAGQLQAPAPLNFPAADQVPVTGQAYGTGTHGVVLVPGAHGVGETWHLQAHRLSRSGFRVLAMDYRGLGAATGVTQDGEKAHLDVIGAVRRLKALGATRVSLVGASWGGRAAARAALAEPELIDRLVLIGPSEFDGAERLKNPTLIIVAQDDRDGSGEARLVNIRHNFERLPGPRKLVVVNGAAHAQFLFLGPQGEHAYAEMLRFLR